MKNGQNTDLNNQNIEFGGRLKSQKVAKNEFTHGNNELLCSRVSRYKIKHKFKKNYDIIRQISLINPDFELFKAQNVLFLTIFGQNQTNLRMTGN